MDEELERFKFLHARMKDFDDETRIDIFREFLEFMKTNREKYRFTDEMIEKSERRLERAVKAVEKAAEAERLAEIARKEFAVSVEKLEEELVSEMEKNGGKPVPVFINVPVKRGN